MFYAEEKEEREKKYAKVRCQRIIIQTTFELWDAKPEKEKKNWTANLKRNAPLFFSIVPVIWRGQCHTIHVFAHGIAFIVSNYKYHSTFASSCYFCRNGTTLKWKCHLITVSSKNVVFVWVCFWSELLIDNWRKSVHSRFFFFARAGKICQFFLFVLIYAHSNLKSRYYYRINDVIYCWYYELVPSKLPFSWRYFFFSFDRFQLKGRHHWSRERLYIKCQVKGMPFFLDR